MPALGSLVRAHQQSDTAPHHMYTSEPSRCELRAAVAGSNQAMLGMDLEVIIMCTWKP